MKSSRVTAKMIALTLALTCMMSSSLIFGPPEKNETFPKQIGGANRTLPTEPTEVAETETAMRAQVTKAYGQPPMSFEANHGQTDSQVKFISRDSDHSLFLTSTEAVLVLSKPATHKGRKDFLATNRIDDAHTTEPPAVLRMKLAGANPAPQIAGQDELPGKSNYFIDKESKKWQTNIPNYSKVKYTKVYPGIDMVYYGNQRQLEYDFVVAAGADPQNIKLAFAGANDLSIDARGELLLRMTDGGDVRQPKPEIYQRINGIAQKIAGGYVIDEKDQVGFEIAAYDHSKPLVIDPTLVYSTLIGGSNWDLAFGLAVGTSGSAYITGATFSIDFPTANPFQSTAVVNAGGIFVTKLNPEGTAIVYSTYFGGNGGVGLGIAVDRFGSAYVTGFGPIPTTPGASSTAPGNSGSGSTAFVAKLSPAGSALVYSTYLSRGPFSVDEANGIAVDASGNAYVTGWTSADSFPVVNPVRAQRAGGIDAFVTKLNADGSALIYSTFLGGSNTDEGLAIAVDASGRAYVTGFTNSNNFPKRECLSAHVRRCPSH